MQQAATTSGVMLGLLLCLAVGCAAQAAPRGESPVLRQYLRADGLGNLGIQSLYQDVDGTLWVGTDGGLYRHDGDRLRSVAVPREDRGALVRGVVSDGEGGQWIGTAGRLLHRDARGVMQQVSLPDRVLRPLAWQPMQRLADGRLLFNAQDPVSGRRDLFQARRGDDARWQVTPVLAAQTADWSEAEREVRLIAVAPDGAWWFGCGMALCRRGSDEALQRWTVPVEDHQPTALRHLLPQADGSLWVLTETSLLHWRDGRFIDMTPPAFRAAQDRSSSTLVRDQAGRILFASHDTLYRWDGARWESWGPDSGVVAGTRIGPLMQDADGDLWYGSLGLGLLRWSGYGRWTAWTAGSGLPNASVWAIAFDRQGDIWLATARGLARSAGASAPAFDMHSSGLDSTAEITDLLTGEDGSLWLYEPDRGLLVRRGEAAWKQVARALPDQMRMTMRGDQAWIATADSLWQIDTRLPAPVQPRRIELPSDSAAPLALFDLCVDGRGQLWIAHRNGLIVHDAQGARAVAAQGLPPQTGASTLRCNGERVYAVTFDEQLYEIDADGRQARRIDLPALEGMILLSMLRDRRGRLWLGTDRGLLVDDAGQWRLFNQGDGLVWDDTNQWALAEGPDGAIWIGTSRGLARIDDPDALLAAVTAPLPLRLTEASYGDQMLQPGETRQRLAWTRHPLILHWAVSSYGNRDGLRTRYRLVGLDDHWSETAIGELQYAGLSAGSYRLELQATDLHGRHSSQTQVLAFEIAPPWWRSLPVQLAAALAALLAVWAATRWRLRQLVRRQAELQALVSERTRELAASHADLHRLATTDPLTGAMNRRALLEGSQAHLTHLLSHGGTLTLVLADVDHFKRINDVYGHLAGDALLCGVVARLSRTLREGDLLGRYGGEEFMLVLPGLSMHNAAAAARVQALLDSIAAQPFDVGGGVSVTITCSMGAVTFNVPAGGAPDNPAAVQTALIARADAALYRAKAAGRNRVEVAGE